MKVEVIPSLNETQFTSEIVVDGSNVTLKQAFETVNAATSGRYKISIQADVYEEDLVLTSVVPLVIEGNDHIISNCIPVNENLLCDVRPDWLIVDGDIHLVSSSVANPFDINQYEVVDEYEGTRSGNSWPYTVTLANVPSSITQNVNEGSSYIMWHSRWLCNLEYITDVSADTITVTPIAARNYNGSDQVHNAYKAMNIVSETEYYYTESGDKYLLHVPYEYSTLMYARKPRVLSLQSACNVTIQNATIIGSNFIHRGGSQGDRNMYYNAALYIKYGANIKIYGCTFQGCPNGAIATRGNVDGLWVEKCDFIDLMSKGIHLGASTNSPTTDLEDELSVHGSPLDNTTHNVYIYDCSFKRCGSLKADATPIFVQNASKVRICNNTILCCSYSAIQVGWAFNREEPIETVSDVYVAYNHIGYVGMHILSDLAAIYTIGKCPNGHIVGNLIHDVYSLTGLLGMGCYNDESSRYWHWYKNFVCGCDRFFQNNYNYGNEFDSCFFMYSNVPAIALNSPFGVLFYGCVFKTNQEISNNPHIQTDMCIFNSTPKVSGKEIKGRYIIADPIDSLFTDVVHQDFSMKENSYATISYNGSNFTIYTNDTSSSFIGMKIFGETKGVVSSRVTRDSIGDSFEYDGKDFDISDYSRFICTTALYGYSNMYINASITQDD